MSMNGNVSRRQFLTTAAGTAVGAVGFPYLISSAALGKDGNVAPSERIFLWPGRKIRFYPQTEEIIGDPVASQMLGRAYRSPWYL